MPHPTPTLYLGRVVEEHEEYKGDVGVDQVVVVAEEEGVVVAISVVVVVVVAVAVAGAPLMIIPHQ